MATISRMLVKRWSSEIFSHRMSGRYGGLVRWPARGGGGSDRGTRQARAVTILVATGRTVRDPSVFAGVPVVRAPLETLLMPSGGPFSWDSTLPRGRSNSTIGRNVEVP